MALAQRSRSNVALLMESAWLPPREVVALLEDLETEDLHTLEGDWLTPLVQHPPEALLVVASPERERQVIAAASALQLPVLGGEDRLLAMAGDRGLLHAWLRAVNLPALPVFRPEQGPPLPRPFDLQLERQPAPLGGTRAGDGALAGSRTLSPATAAELEDLTALLSATLDRHWWSPRTDDRVVVGLVAGEPLGAVGLKQISRGTATGSILATQATIPAPLSTVETSEVLALARRAAASLGLTAPCEVELGRLEGRYVVCDVRRNLALDHHSPLGRLLLAFGIPRHEVLSALRSQCLVAEVRPRPLPAAAAPTVH